MPPLAVKCLLRGILSFVPGASLLFRKSSGGTLSARYCYSVWLRHLVMASHKGLSTQPATVAELGPGNSLGTGLAALLTGSERYYAFDVVKHSNLENNLKVFEELVELFEKRERIPGPEEFPEVKPYLESYEFPSEILSDDRLRQTMRPDRLKSIRNSLLALSRQEKGNGRLFYFVPWDEEGVLQAGSVDMIYSQATLEHVDELLPTYRALNRWLKREGFMSHQIDFRSHDTAKEWNGHWAHSDFRWSLIRGRNRYLLNRAPYSSHVHFLKQLGFEVVGEIKLKKESGVSRSRLARRFQHLSDEDLTTSGVFLQAVKRGDRH